MSGTRRLDERRPAPGVVYAPAVSSSGSAASGANRLSAACSAGTSGAAVARRRSAHQRRRPRGDSALRSGASACGQRRSARCRSHVPSRQAPRLWLHVDTTRADIHSTIRPTRRPERVTSASAW